MLQITNRTPHDLTIYPNGTPSEAPIIIKAATREHIARVTTIDQVLRRDACLEGIVPITATQWGRIVGLPDYADGVAHVVSVVVVEAARAAGRTTEDLYVPGGQIRDGSGRIIGCASIGVAATAMPSSTAADWVRAMRAMGATVLRGPVWSDGHHIGLYPINDEEWTVHAIEEGRGVVGTINAWSDEVPIRQGLPYMSDVRRAWLASGGTIDEEGPVVLHRGEAVVGMTGGRLREGVMTREGVRVPRHEAGAGGGGWATVVGHDLIPVAEWTALRPKSAIGTVGVAVVARDGEAY